MKIAIVSIQRNRNPYIIEWLAFHLNMGVTQFYIYAHKCDDGMLVTLQKLSKFYPITVIDYNENVRPQLTSYSDAYQQYGHEHDWLAFIDGDEFLFPVKSSTLDEVLTPFINQPLSALAVYWMCYGTSGHVDEPNGLVLENFTRHAHESSEGNFFFKSIIKGRSNQCCCQSSFF